MKSFKIEETRLISKIIDNTFNKLVIIGKNGSGKTTFSEKIIASLDSKGIKSYFIKADLNLDKELKNAKDNNLQKLGLLLNELTNFRYEIETKELDNFFKENESFFEFCKKSDSSLSKIQKWMDDNFIDKRIKIADNDSDLKSVKVNKPKIINSNIFELNYNKKINMGSVFNSLTEDAGSGQYFYTILQLINKVLEFYSETREKSLYLIIDEPEKFCHPELIIKIANSLKSINNKIVKVICISHSSLFVNNFINNLDELILLENFNNFFQYSDSLFIENTKDILQKMLEISNKFKTNKNLKNKSLILDKLVQIYKIGINDWFNNWPIKNDFINSLFYEKIILCEGLNDEYFLNCLSLKTNIFILKSFGKFEIPFLKSVLSSFDKKIYVVYDSDINNKNDSKSQERNQFWNEINNILKEKCNINEKNSYGFNYNLESAIEIDLDKDLKNYIPRMNLFINNQKSLSRKMKKIQSILLKSINDFFKSFNEDNIELSDDFNLTKNLELD
ncbi:hypothetical protein LT336_00098 [Spiroplasma sp. JKS002671]|uniref:hypothetical protein n=1 Tax=Spiroplasma attinicola TaxID=2904537 RepID=UPI002022A28A|nr:hypothetical protein [Spiroplasma sp. JKS002671]MCL8210368.1 hypothetical protein [Spiroplasma sp. JKS002671]